MNFKNLIIELKDLIIRFEFDIYVENIKNMQFND